MSSFGEEDKSDFMSYDGSLGESLLENHDDCHSDLLQVSGGPPHGNGSITRPGSPAENRITGAVLRLIKGD